MDSPNLIIIVAAELCVLLLIVCIFLSIQNRSLRMLVSQLREKARGILQELKEVKAASPPPPQVNNVETQDDSSYLQFVDDQIEFTRTHHTGLNTGQDISLDLEPEVPLIHRTPALRNAMLLAEKDALSQTDNNEPDWRILRKRYEQIFSFYNDFADSSDSEENSEEAEALQADLEIAKSRVKNLEKFQKLYFDLEEKWQASKLEAQSHFENLSNITAELENGDEVNKALQNYHQSYDEFSNVLERGVDGSTIVDAVGGSDGKQAAEEVRRLRSVAADQHRIIEGLQRQLISAKTEDERHNVVVSLQEELQKQTRFAQESETCIQLLEDELNGAHKDIEQLKAKLHQLPDIKADLIDFRNQYDELELKFHNSITENRKLQKQLQASKKDSGSAGDSAKLRKELSEMAVKYNELEEKFLDLKMQQ